MADVTIKEFVNKGLEGMGEDITSLGESVTNLGTQLKTVGVGTFSGCYLGKTLSKLYRGQDVSICFIGDSVTCGSAATPSQALYSYTGLFAKWLAQQFPDSKVILARGKNMESCKPIAEYEEQIIQEGTKNTILIQNAGLWGDTVFWMMNRSNEWLKYNDKFHDAYFISSGINETTTGDKTKNVDTATFVEMITSMIDFIRDMTEDKAEIALQTPHWMGASLSTSPVPPYAQEIRRIAKDKNILCVDHNFVWVTRATSLNGANNQGDWLSDDTIHPTNKGHEAMFNTLIKHLYDKRRVSGQDSVIFNFDNKTVKMTDFEDYTITDDVSKATYLYKRCSTADKNFTTVLAGNEIYAIVRQGREECTFENNSSAYTTTSNTVTIPALTYPAELKTTSGNNAELYSAQHKRVQLYKGDFIQGFVTIKLKTGTLDIWGFECITYK